MAAIALAEARFEVTETMSAAVSEGSRLWIELFSRAAANQLRDFYHRQEELAGPTVTSILETTEKKASDMAAKVDQAEALARALVKRERLREELLRWMKATPLILAPVGAVPAFDHGTKRLVIGDESLSVFRAFSYSQALNVFGLPGVCVRAGQSAEGLPIGVQIVGRPNEEKTILAAAAVIEETLGGWRRPLQF